MMEWSITTLELKGGGDGTGTGKMGVCDLNFIIQIEATKHIK